MKYKIGDKVIITANKSGHMFGEGAVVTITHKDFFKGANKHSYAGDDAKGWQWWFASHECIPYSPTNREASKALLDEEY